MEVLSLGLLFMEFIDAIREGDGDRICSCWKFLLLIFKATGRKNYAIALLAQLKFVLSPRMAAQLEQNGAELSTFMEGQGRMCHATFSWST